MGKIHLAICWSNIIMCWIYRNLRSNFENKEFPEIQIIRGVSKKYGLELFSFLTMPWMQANETREGRIELSDNTVQVWRLHGTFAILGSTISANVATQEGDHGCYHYFLIYAIKPNFKKYLSNTNEFNLNSTSCCCYFVSEICKQTVCQQMNGNFL